MIKNLPYDERPREKLINQGVNSLSTSELLAIILRTGTSNCSAIQLGQRILESCVNSLYELENMTLEELCKIDGIGSSKACQIISSIELGKRIQRSNFKSRKSINSPDSIFQFFRYEIGYSRVEKFVAVFLNIKNEIIHWEVVSVGTLNASIVHPREVYNRAIKWSSAGIIVLHNHPSGNAAPSKEDLSITARLVEAGKIIGIPLIDHIIIGNEKYYSFKENNQLMDCI